MERSKGLSTGSNRTGLSGRESLIRPSRDDGVSKKVNKTQNKEDKRVEIEKKGKKIVYKNKDNAKVAWPLLIVNLRIPGRI